MAYYVKQGVLLSMTPEIHRMLHAIADPIFEQYGALLTVTCGMDGEHKPSSGRTSLHYHAKAFDMRTSGIPADILNRIWTDIQAAIASRKWPVQIVRETDHWHWEWDAP